MGLHGSGEPVRDVGCVLRGGVDQSGESVGADPFHLNPGDVDDGEVDVQIEEERVEPAPEAGGGDVLCPGTVDVGQAVEIVMVRDPDHPGTAEGACVPGDDGVAGKGLSVRDGVVALRLV